MISTTVYVASRLAITGLISVLFFEETVLRPIRSGPRKVSAGLVVSAFKSTIILILAADEAASIYLSNDNGAPSAGGHTPGPDAVPAPTRLLRTVCPACKLRQGTMGCYPPASVVLPVPAQKVLLPFQSSPSSSSPVFRSTTPCDITTTLDLPYFANCTRLSITSDTTLVAWDDDRLKDVLLPFQPSPSPSSSSPVFRPTTPCDITTTLDLPYFPNCKRLSITSDTTLVAWDDDHLKDVLLPFQHHLSSPVLESTSCDITTTLNLPNLAICNRLSITSDTTLVASDDDSRDVFSDKDNHTTPPPGLPAPAHTTNDDRVDVPAPITTIDIISPLCTPYIRPLVLLVDKYQTTPTSITNHSIPGSTHLTDALLQMTKTANSLHSSPSVVPNGDFMHLEGAFTGTDEALDTKNIKHHINTPLTPALATHNALAIRNAPSHPLNLRSLALLDKFPMSFMNTDTNPSGSTHPTDVLAHKTKAAASWLKPLMLVTKYAASRLIRLPHTALSYQPVKLRPYKLKQQKCRPRAVRMNAACHSIVRSRLRRHADRTVGHLVQVCEQIRIDKADLVDAWVTAMMEVGLTSMLASNHRTSLASPLPPTFDALSVLEPGSRTKARLMSLRHRTSAVAATIPATTTFPLSLPRRRTS
ncbi:hypothetical protein F4604DRAFT_96030 [Suillus subluteus]|nr:hypothetical protein F4604DRAFT_96030 [Suillus subluteus]